MLELGKGKGARWSEGWSRGPQSFKLIDDSTHRSGWKKINRPIHRSTHVMIVPFLAIQPCAVCISHEKTCSFTYTKKTNLLGFERRKLILFGFCVIGYFWQGSDRIIGSNSLSIPDFGLVIDDRVRWLLCGQCPLWRPPHTGSRHLNEDHRRLRRRWSPGFFQCGILLKWERSKQRECQSQQTTTSASASWANAWRTPTQHVQKADNQRCQPIGQLSAGNVLGILCVGIDIPEYCARSACTGNTWAPVVFETPWSSSSPPDHCQRRARWSWSRSLSRCFLSRPCCSCSCCSCCCCWPLAIWNRARPIFLRRVQKHKHKRKRGEKKWIDEWSEEWK